MMVNVFSLLLMVKGFENIFLHSCSTGFRLCTDLDGSTGTMAMGANDFAWYVTGRPLTRCGS